MHIWAQQIYVIAQKLNLTPNTQGNKRWKRGSLKIIWLEERLEEDFVRWLGKKSDPKESC